MIKKIKMMITTLSITGFVFVPAVLVGAPAIAHAQTQNQVGQLCNGATLNVNTSSPGTCDNSSGGAISNLLKFVLNIFSILVGVTAVIMIVVGGFKYIVSGGESSRVSGAKDTILFAIVGLVVVALAQIIVHFVLSSLSNNNIGTGS
jgi:hypothetical protein